jgi:hypothetical protein
VATKIQLRRGTASEWTAANPTLSAGELGFETNTGKFKIGNGSSLWNALDYFLDSSELSSEYATQSYVDEVTSLINIEQAAFDVTLGVWTTRTSNFGNTAILSVAYGNGLWVAGGRSGQIRSSTDAITWTTRTSNLETASITSISYGNGLWVAGGTSGGYGGQIRTSTDAITWTTQNSNFGNTQISSVAYGNGLWVAAGYSGQLRTSTEIAGTSYTLQLSDNNSVIEMNNASANTITIPLNSSVAFPIGSNIDIVQTGAGQTTITPAEGVTIRSSNSETKLTGQYSGATIYKRGTNEWVLFGDLSA